MILFSEFQIIFKISNNDQVIVIFMQKFQKTQKIQLLILKHSKIQKY